MAGCKTQYGIGRACDDALRVGGLNPTVWIGYKSELDTQISLAQTGDILTLDFGSYGGLRRFDGAKFSHSYTDNLVVSSTGRNKSYLHSLTIRVLANSTQDDVTIQDLNLGEDIFAIVQDNNSEFFILGAGNGLSTQTDDHGSGETGDADTSDTITLTSSEKTKALRFGGSLAYIESFEL